MAGRHSIPTDPEFWVRGGGYRVIRLPSTGRWYRTGDISSRHPDGTRYLT